MQTKGLELVNVEADIEAEDRVAALQRTVFEDVQVSGPIRVGGGDIPGCSIGHRSNAGSAPLVPIHDDVQHI